MKNMLANPY